MPITSFADDAIGHAVAAGEMTWAARLIEENFDERFYLHGEVSTVRRWLALLPPELAGLRAPACCWRGPGWPFSTAAWRRPKGSWTWLGAGRPMPMRGSSRPPGRLRACW